MKDFIKRILKNIGLFMAIKFLYHFFCFLINSIRNFLIPTAIILTYHRISIDADDPHKLTVSPDNFYKQLTYLKSKFHIIHLSELYDCLKNKKLRKNTMVITFDDGYADNFYYGLPILRELNIPATIFITSGLLDGENFYWDKNKSSKYCRPLSSFELKKLIDQKLITIGGHTLSHQHLPLLDNNQKSIEILEDRNKLATICNKEINFFAYPFGDYDKQSMKLVEDAGYNCGFILENRRVSIFCKNMYKIPRFIVRNWELKCFIKKIRYYFI